MTGFLSLFSPAGSVGRGAYWLASFLWVGVVLSCVVYFGSLLQPFAGDLPKGETLGRIETGRSSPEETREAIAHFDAAFKAVFQNDANQILAIAAVLLIGSWCFAMIEVKRWHDRGYSGTWFLIIRLVPALFRVFAPPLVSLAVVLLIGLWAFVQLALLPGIGVDEGYSTSGRRRSTSRVSWRQTEAGVSITAVLLVVRIAIFVYFHFFHSATHAAPAFASVSPPGEETQNAGTQAAAAPAPEPGSPTAAAPLSLPALSNPVAEPKPPLDPAALHGTSDTNFGRNWIVVDGQRIDGIISAMPAPEGEVALLYGAGGKNVRASALPQGFLDSWNLTPARLQAADNP
jgi:uncharacterized membrane protein YhaH (DUF805 family)